MPSWTRASRGNGRDIYAVQAQLNQMSLREFPPIHFEASRLISAISNSGPGLRNQNSEFITQDSGLRIHSNSILTASTCHLVVKNAGKNAYYCVSGRFGSFQVPSARQKRMQKCVLLCQQQILQLPSAIWTSKTLAKICIIASAAAFSFEMLSIDTQLVRKSAATLYVAALFQSKGLALTHRPFEKARQRFTLPRFFNQKA